jgi:superfamily II DNA or RNA helicase
MRGQPVLRAYQTEAIDKWRSNNFKGLFEMATGTGKTITSLYCAKSLLDEEGVLNLIILVPTIDLADQWKGEIKQILFPHVIVANSKNTNWYKDALHAVNDPGHTNYCIVATYATFLTKRFVHIVSKVSSSAMLIADEAHNFGTQKHVSVYPNQIQRRLGLSATPERHFDEMGTKDLRTYFGAENGATFSFGMAEAIKKHFLCEYYYYPVIVRLTETELKEYKEISRKLLLHFDKNVGSFRDNPIVKILLLKRKRIIHNASNKFDVFRGILTELLNNHKALKYVLVYVPEGNEKKPDEDDLKLINEYSGIISKEFGLLQHQFIGITKKRSQILDEFSKGRISVLTAMKCLDEGVDVKRAQFAIFCSSTGNPRQFIQRRGRILRTHPDKDFATIYDLVVAPAVTSQYFEDSLQMERTILQNELRRVREFASLSLNHYQALHTLELVAKEFELDIYSNE